MLKKIIKNLIFITIITLFSSGVFISFKSFVFASSTDGAIDSTYKYAWGENIGWLNFGTTEGNAHVTDSALTGYIWAENIGWISLNCSNESSCATVDYKISNDGEGNLTGYAWSENTGWINFNPTYGGVTINSSGEFSGYAWGENIGWIVFNCATTNSCATVDYKVKTDWRPRSARVCTSWTYSDWSSCSNGQQTRTVVTSSPSGCSGGSPILSQSCSSGGDEIDEIPVEQDDEEIPKEEPIVKLPLPEVKPPAKKPKKPIVERVPEILKPLIPEIFKPQPPEVSIKELVPRETPLVFQGKWQLLPREPIRKFVLTPLPKAIRNLAQKFPTLEKTFEEVGIGKITDVAKLKTAKFTLPGLTERVGLSTTKVEPGKFALPQGIPVANLSPSAKRQLPTEIVFAKTGGELIDFNLALSVTEMGEPREKISTISGKPLQLAVKPDKPVKSVKGYVVFKSKGSQPVSLEFPPNSLLASVIFSNPVFAKIQEKPVRVEEKLVLLEFEYTDPDGDGIYTAEIQAPLVGGEYDIITVMDFDDPELGKKEIRLTTVIDPEGYLYEKNGDKETRIPGAIISLFWLNPETKQYEIWPAKVYQQENPQTTDVRGTYSFLVPEGYYYLKAEAPGYLVYDGKPFQVKEGSGIHINIELKTKYWWLKIVDWKTILLTIVIILLIYNFYRDKTREGLIKSKKI